MKIKKLNESYINKLNNLPSERGISKVSYELIKEYQNILKSYPVGKILRHRIDAGEEIFTKIEDGEYGWWEHYRVWRGDKQRISEFDMAEWLAGRAVISRSDIIEENLNDMKIKKLNESSAPSKETLDDCLQDYVNNAFGYDGVEDYVDTQYPMHSQEFKSEIINYLKQNIINESKYISEDTSYEWNPNTSFKHIKDIYNKVKENNYKYVNNEREEFMAAVKKADNKGYKPEQCRQIKDWHRDVWQHNKKNESFDVDKVQKRIARHNEFDNGHVLHDWQNMTSQEAEDKAREASIKNPDDIYYVAYDNIMEPASDIKWKNGKQIDESFNDNWSQRFKGMKVFINGNFQIKSVYFANGKEGWELGTWTDSGRYTVIDRFLDIDEAKQKAHELKHPLEKPFEDDLNESNNIKHIYYHEDPTGLKRGQWLDVKEEDGKIFAKWNFSDKWSDITDRIEEGPYHRFNHKKSAKSFNFGGWQFWLDDEVEKFWDIEGNRVSDDFEIPGMPHVKRNKIEEDIDDEKQIVQRYLDIEIPDILSRLIDFLPKMYESDIKIVKNHCRRFYDQLNSMLSYYVAHKDGSYIELEDTSIIDELGFAGAVEMKGSKVCADEETLRQLCDAIHSEYGWQPKIEESLNESNINLEDRYNTLLAAYGRELRDLMNTNKDGCNDDKIKEMQDKIADTKKKISSALKEHVEITALEGPKEGPKVGLSSLLTDAIKDEWEAIETYNSLAVTARAEGFEDIANKIDEINTDENTHVGKLQELLKTISPNAEAIEFGQKYANDISDDMSEEDVLAYTDRYM